MGRRSEGSPELMRVHIWLAKSDVEELQLLFNETVGFSRGVRAILGKYLRHVRQQTDAGKRTVDLPPAAWDS